MNSNNQKAGDLSKDWLSQGVKWYEKGNITKAIRKLTLSASLGSAEACNYLHLIYLAEKPFINEGLARAYKNQYFWRLKCLSGHGDRDAIFSLARIVYFGDEDLPPDRSAAIKAIADLAESDHLEAQLYLVEMYRDGMDEMPADQGKAEYWLRRAAKLRASTTFGADLE